MTSQSKIPPLPLPETYKHQIDTRSEVQKLLSNKIATQLSDLNIKRIRQIDMDKINAEIQDAYFFLCISGLPPIQGEFEKICLPGEKRVLTLSGYEKDYTEQERIQLFQNLSWDFEADRLRRTILQVSKQKKKKIILVYHSFGSYIACVYFRKYKQDHHIRGIVALGGVPITFYPLIREFVKHFRFFTEQVLLVNADAIQEEYIKNSKNKPYMTTNNKYQTISFLKLLTSSEFEKMFENMRNFPKVLKFIAYGRSDAFFEEQLLNQMFIHYSYVNKPDQMEHSKALEAYEQLYGKKVRNVQERFCLSFEGGKHSLHIQSKVAGDLKLGIRQYLWILSKIDKKS